MEKKSSVGIILFLLLGLGLSGCTKNPWIEFSSPQGNFAILMPAEPTPTLKPIKTETGIINSHMFIYRKGKSATYIVSYADYPEGSLFRANPHESLNEATNKLAKKMASKVLSKSNIWIDAYPGKEIRMKTINAETAIFRIFAVKQRFYQISFLMLANAKVSQKEIEKFLNSFRLLGNL